MATAAATLSCFVTLDMSAQFHGRVSAKLYYSMQVLPCMRVVYLMAGLLPRHEGTIVML